MNTQKKKTHHQQQAGFSRLFFHTGKPLETKKTWPLNKPIKWSLKNCTYFNYQIMSKYGVPWSGLMDAKMIHLRPAAKT